MEKIALVAFNGELMCFVHVMLNALDLAANGHDVKVIIEGSATKLVKTLADPKQPFANLYQKMKDNNLIDAFCKACAAKMGALDAATAQKLPLGDDMSGHPSLRPYILQGYQIITF